MNDPTVQRLHALAIETGAALSRKGWMLATAESCTGGWVSGCITGVAGSSAWFDRGFVTYSNEAKCDMLGVDSEVLETHGAVSEDTVRAMARGALRNSRAQVALAVSGIAGPAGGTADKPVGTVWFAWAWRYGGCRVRLRCFEGDRWSVRAQAVEMALQGVLDVCDS